MKKIYQQPLIDIIKINAEDLLKDVVASEEDDAAGAKKADFDYLEDEDWEQDRWFDGGR
ncbi:hypothetical protein [Hoylesella buccalis]|uniref:hypothetical protein n=1 Tax=Hoylesella buccalis TaxID=28127 RepID=UPI0015E098DD|nr:hypothetical protein [Hoylesella buccalis]